MSHPVTASGLSDAQPQEKRLTITEIFHDLVAAIDTRKPEGYAVKIHNDSSIVLYESTNVRIRPIAAMDENKQVYPMPANFMQIRPHEYDRFVSEMQDLHRKLCP